MERTAPRNCGTTLSNLKEKGLVRVRSFGTIPG